MYPLPTPLFWQRSSSCGKWKWQTNWNYWGLNILVETFHKVPSNGKVKVTNATVLIYLDHNCSHMSNWASVTHQNKSESEKTGKGGWFQYFIQMRILSWLRQLRFLWHRELHFTPSLLHLHLFDRHLVWHEHLKKPPVLLCRQAASLTPCETLSGTSADERNFWVSNSNRFLENCVFSVPTLVPNVQRPVSSSWSMTTAVKLAGSSRPLSTSGIGTLTLSPSSAGLNL